MIEITGDALTYLLDVIKRSEEIRRDIYRISIDPRRDGIAIKTNESIWTPTLSN